MPANTKMDGHPTLNESMICYTSGTDEVLTMRRIFTILITFLVLITITAVPEANAQGRGKIGGKVVDAATGEVLPGVNVVIVGTTLGSATDIDGDYFIANLEPGIYDVRASFVGYQDVIVQGVNVSADATAEVNFEMQELTLQGEEVVIVATRPLVEQDNTTSVTRLETTEITTRPTTELTDVLTSLPSVNMEGGEMRIRGGSTEEVAFVLDGSRARNPLDHSPYTRINLSSIQELEVITGSFNAEYGEAQSGVINVITKEGGPSYELFVDARFEPPGKKHWGVGFYDQSTDVYWENTHARHLEWWIEYPDQWVDPNGVPGSDPRSMWTPEEAYQNYLDTHKPLTDYTEIPTYQVEVGLGGPVPLTKKLFFFGTVKYRSQPPLLGNAFREKGTFLDGTLKLSYQFAGGKKLTFSGFYGKEETGWGYYLDTFWADTYGVDSRYAYYDQEGYPTSITNGQTLRFSHALNASTLYELKLSRIEARRRVWTLPGDPIGWDASEATRDNLRAVDETGTAVPGGYANRIGYHTSGYLFRFNDVNSEWKLDGNLSSQLSKYVHVKTGLEFSYYNLDHFNQSKFAAARDSAVYRPYQGAIYTQSKFELGGFIMNAGLRFDFYNPNDTVFVDLFNPLEGEKRKTKLYTQLSPRLGVSHPIDARTVLHFSYGHFFQRPSFGDYGELLGFGQGSLTTLVVDGTNLPSVLGNRNLRPEKVVSFEVGIERNFWNFFVLDVTGFYKDYRNTVSQITIQAPSYQYVTTANSDYADQRGVEISVRKTPSSYKWGSIWGYANYSKQFGIFGRSGAPSVIRPDGVRYRPSGDIVAYYNPYIKAGIYYETPTNWKGLLGKAIGGLSVSFDYQAVLPNDQLRQDYFLFEGKKYMRPADQNLNMRAQKEFSFGPNLVSVRPYVEINNLMNAKWIALGTFERASMADQRQFVESGFEYLPSETSDGIPILDYAKYRNLPRSIAIGIAMQF